MAAYSKTQTLPTVEQLYSMAELWEISIPEDMKKKEDIAALLDVQLYPKPIQTKEERDRKTLRYRTLNCDRINERQRAFIEKNPETKRKWNETYWEKTRQWRATHEEAFFSLSPEERTKYKRAKVCKICRKPFVKGSLATRFRRDIYKGLPVHTSCIPKETVV